MRPHPIRSDAFVHKKAHRKASQTFFRHEIFGTGVVMGENIIYQLQIRCQCGTDHSFKSLRSICIKKSDTYS